MRVLRQHSVQTETSIIRCTETQMGEKVVWRSVGRMVETAPIVTGEE